MKALLSVALVLAAPVAAWAQSAATPPGAATASTVPMGAVVAKRGDGVVTFSDVDVRMTELPTDKREGFIDSPQRIDSMLGQLLLIKQLANEGRRSHLENDPEYQRRLSLARDRLLAEARLRELASEPLTGDMQVAAKEIYQAYPERFDTGEVLVIRHAIVKDEAEAKAVRDRVLKGESFEALARELSRDRVTAEKGGVIEIGKNSQVIPGVADAARKLAKPGDMSVVEIKQGGVVMQLMERKPSRKLAFDEVRSLLVNEATMNARNKQIKDHIDGLTNLPIDAQAENVAALRTRYPGGEIPGTTPAQ